MILLVLLLAWSQSPADGILGRWEGTSTCVRVDWNSSCHDEVVKYEVERDSTAPAAFVFHAFKRVGSTWDPMGDLPLRWDSAGHRWVGEFTNSRVHLEISFWLDHARLVGQLMDLPDRRKARDMAAHR
jgi:hypothetical protein